MPNFRDKNKKSIKNGDMIIVNWSSTESPILQLLTIRQIEQYQQSSMLYKIEFDDEREEYYYLNSRDITRLSRQRHKREQELFLLKMEGQIY